MSILIRQLIESESSTLTYIIKDIASREAIIIDPVLETLERDLQILNELKVNLKYIAETHIHADHITSSSRIKDQLGGKIIVSEKSGLETADHLLSDGEEIYIGDTPIKILQTPGHTDSCVSYLIESSVFTGDALLIRGCGRTDFQQGSSDKLFESVRDKLFKLPDSTTVYPAHDYQGRMSSTIGEEKEFNPRLNLKNNKTKFKEIMANLKLEKPQKIDVAVPANLKSGQL